MKTFVLCLLFLSSLCFALGDEEAKNENDFIDVDSDEGEVPDNEQLPEEDEEENVGHTSLLNLCLIEIIIH